MNACRKCGKEVKARHAAYVFAQTGGLCWACHDRMEQERYFKGRTLGQQEEITARWLAVDAVSDEECRRHCQVAGLPGMEGLK